MKDFSFASLNFVRVCFLMCCFLCTSVGFTQSSFLEEYVRPNVRTKVGKQVRTYKDNWGNCLHYPFSAYVSQNPKFGKIELIKGTAILVNKKNIVSDGTSSVVSNEYECAGETVPAVNIYYTPNKNFTGIDVFKVKVKTPDYPDVEFTRIIYVE